MAEIHTLFNGRKTDGWQGVSDTDMSAAPYHLWHACADVPLDPSEAGKFAIQPGTGVLVNGAQGNTLNLATVASYGDCDLHIEFVVPKGSNSGVYFMGRYEIQILDSWQAHGLRFSTCGGVYARWIDETAVGGAPPRINASRPPGEWQEYDIRFRAPRFELDGTRSQRATFEQVVWNGELVHKNVELDGPTRASMAEDEVPRGPLMIQGDHGPVGFRNIHLTEL